MNYRPLSNIAHDIRRDWKNVYFGAVPYLNTMLQMGDISESYGYDDGKSIVRYFLGNAKNWRGPVAITIKAELKAMLAGKPVQS